LAVRAEVRDELAEASAAAPARSPGYATAARRLDAAGTIVSEVEALAVLWDYGVAVPRHSLAKSAPEAARIAAEIGFPVALKVQSPQIPHKSDAGAVALGLCDANSVAASFEAAIASARRAVPTAEIQGVLVEAMARPGPELILGITCDDTFGSMLLLGRGGIDVETVADRVLTPLPLDMREAERLIDLLDRGRLLGPRHGRHARDRQALVALMLTVAGLAQDFAGRIREIDLNPVIVGVEGEGVAVVDALMVQGART
jgi:acyl-CoA synthetase (NDP forming)